MTLGRCSGIAVLVAEHAAPLAELLVHTGLARPGWWRRRWRSRPSGSTPIVAASSRTVAPRCRYPASTYFRSTGSVRADHAQPVAAQRGGVDHQPRGHRLRGVHGADEAVVGHRLVDEPAARLVDRDDARLRPVPDVREDGGGAVPAAADGAGEPERVVVTGLPQRPADGLGEPQRRARRALRGPGVLRRGRGQVAAAPLGARGEPAAREHHAAPRPHPQLPALVGDDRADDPPVLPDQLGGGGGEPHPSVARPQLANRFATSALPIASRVPRG